MELALEGGEFGEGLEALDRILGLHLPRTRVVVGLRCDDVCTDDGVAIGGGAVVVVPRGIQVGGGEGGERGQRVVGGVLGSGCAQQ